jgi:hypothetical protein
MCMRGRARVVRLNTWKEDERDRPTLCRGGGRSTADLADVPAAWRGQAACHARSSRASCQASSAASCSAAQARSTRWARAPRSRPASGKRLRHRVLDRHPGQDLERPTEATSCPTASGRASSLSIAVAAALGAASAAGKNAAVPAGGLVAGWPPERARPTKPSSPRCRVGAVPAGGRSRRPGPAPQRRPRAHAALPSTARRRRTWPAPPAAAPADGGAPARRTPRRRRPAPAPSTAAPAAAPSSGPGGHRPRAGSEMNDGRRPPLLGGRGRTAPQPCARQVRAHLGLQPTPMRQGHHYGTPRTPPWVSPVAEEGVVNRWSGQLRGVDHYQPRHSWLGFPLGMQAGAGAGSASSAVAPSTLTPGHCGPNACPPPAQPAASAALRRLYRNYLEQRLGLGRRTAHGPPWGSGAAAPSGALRAIDPSARPRSWRTCGPRRHSAAISACPACHSG